MDTQKHVKPLLLGATYAALLLVFGGFATSARSNRRR